MIPHDGYSYGKSQYWEWKAKNLALENDEICKHLYDELPIVKYKYDSKKTDFQVKIKIKCPSCKTKFPETEAAMRRKFFEIYAMKTDNYTV